MADFNYDIPDDNSLMILDDSASFRNRLAVALKRRGFDVMSIETVSAAKDIATYNPPAFAILDMRLNDGNGLDVVTVLKEKRPDCRTLVLTGYGNIASAVHAIQAGATNYMAKPADADEICRALLGSEAEAQTPEIPDQPMSANRVKWEHIQRVYDLCGKNVSETARRLKMHRRTLQRILAKRAPL